MPQRFHSRIGPRPQHALRVVCLRQGDDLSDISHFRKALALEAMAVDATWRPDDAYGEAVTESFLDEIQFLEPKARQANADWLQQNTATGFRVYFLCYEDTRLVGFSTLSDWTKCPHEQYHHLGTQISELYVMPGYEKRGIGDMVLKEAEAYARSTGLDRLYLEATIPSERFYLKRGYVDAPPGDSHMDTSDSTIKGRLVYKDLQKTLPGIGAPTR